MAAIGAVTAWRLKKAINGARDQQPVRDGRATVLSRDPDGTVWVQLQGSTIPTPVNGTKTAAADVGQVVSYHLENGRLSITGNATSPSVGSL